MHLLLHQVDSCALAAAACACRKHAHEHARYTATLELSQEMEVELAYVRFDFGRSSLSMVQGDREHQVNRGPARSKSRSHKGRSKINEG